MNKEQYEPLTIEIIEFETEDIITLSTADNDLNDEQAENNNLNNFFC